MNNVGVMLYGLVKFFLILESPEKCIMCKKVFEKYSTIKCNFISLKDRTRGETLFFSQCRITYWRCHIVASNMLMLQEFNLHFYSTCKLIETSWKQLWFFVIPLRSMRYTLNRLVYNISLTIYNALKTTLLFNGFCIIIDEYQGSKLTKL